MTTLVIILRIIHIFGGAFWIGVGLFNIGFLIPTIKATGPEGQKVMQHLTQKTRFQTMVYTAATLTVLSGLGLFWSTLGFKASVLSSGPGLVLTIGGASGIIAWLIAIILVRGIFTSMGHVGRAIQAQGTPPSPEQTAAMQALVKQLGKTTPIALTFLIISLLCMAIAQYVI